jgi:hypothetical protein
MGRLTRGADCDMGESPLGLLECFDYTRAFIFRKRGGSKAALLITLEVSFI